MSWGHRGGRSDWEKGGSGHFGGEEQWPNRERGNRRHSDRYENQGHHGQGGHDRKTVRNAIFLQHNTGDVPKVASPKVAKSWVNFFSEIFFDCSSKVDFI